MNKNYLMIGIAIFSIMCVGYLMCENSDESDASPIYNATSLSGAMEIYIRDNSTTNLTSSTLSFKSSDNTDIIALFIYSTGDNVCFVDGSTNTVCYSNLSTGIVGITWSWSTANPSKCSFTVVTPRGSSSYQTTLSSTSGVSGGIVSVSVEYSAYSAYLDYAIKNDNYTQVSVTGTGGISNWDCRAIYYTLSFAPSGAGYGTLSSNSLVVYQGSTISTNGQTLTVSNQSVTVTLTPNDAQYTYTFNGWSVSSGSVTNDMIIYANITRTTNNYTISIQSNDGNCGTVSSSSITVPYGTGISTSGNILTIGSTTISANKFDNNAQYTYYFNGWDNASGTVTGARTITANFSRTINDYTVSVSSNNTDYGTVDNSSVVVPYGTVPTVNNNVLTVGNTVFTATPATDTQANDYSFDSWSNVVTITGNTSIQAVFTVVAQQYTVTLNSNNSDYGMPSITSLTVDYGTSISTNGAILTIGLTTITPTPTENTAQYAYAFSHWDNNAGNVTENRTITANFTRSIQQYTITVESNNVLYGTVNNSSVTVDWGTVPIVNDNTLTIGTTIFTATATPDTVSDLYWFDRWSNVPESVSSNAVVQAIFQTSPQQCTVTFTSLNPTYGTVSPNSITVDYGSSISISGSTITIDSQSVIATPTTSSDQYTYTFTEWGNASGSITGNREITASFARATNYYTVSIVSNNTDYGTVSIPSVSVAYGTLPTASGDMLTIGSYNILAMPTEETATVSYWLDSWSGITTVKSDMTITAVFQSGTFDFKVTFATIGSGYTTKTTLNVSSGATVTVSGSDITIGSTIVSAIPSESNEQYTYSFNRWDNVASPITADRIIYAVFDSTVNQYTITFLTDKPYGSWQLGTITADYGSSVSVVNGVVTVGNTTNSIVFTDRPYSTCAISSISNPYEGALTSDGTISANLSRTTSVPAFAIVNPEESEPTVETKDGSEWTLVRIIPIFVCIALIIYAVRPKQDDYNDF